MNNLRNLRSAGLDPHVISVLHPEGLAAAGEFYRFYRDNDINQISLAIDEAQGVNATSSFDQIDSRPAMVAFLRSILSQAFSDGYSLHIREIERIARILVGHESPANEQVSPWDVVVVAANGDITSFSPEFMELRSAPHNNFCFGNILRDDLDDLLDNAFLQLASEEISAGVELCRRSCKYFGLCGGGSPSNKMAENKSLKSAETLFCRLTIQASADALIEFLHETQTC
jgi:uncharacterized protein